LVEIGDLDLAQYEESRAQKLSDFFYRTFRKIRGFLDRRTEEIYIDPQLKPTKKNFVTYHEVTHRILPWQRVQYTEDDELTLSSDCEIRFECEANYGAAELLFQCDRFETEARDFQLSLSSAQYLADNFDASYHASIRRFVERNHRPCALLMLKPTARINPSGETSFCVSHVVLSPTFVLRFGDPFGFTFVNPDDELGKILNSERNSEIALKDCKGFMTDCTVELFNNHYTRFALIFPKDIGNARRRVVPVSQIADLRIGR